MKSTTSTHRVCTTTTLVTTTMLLLSACSTSNGVDAAGQTRDPELVTATADPQARQDQVTEQVLDYYKRERMMLVEHERLVEDSARDIATYSWIDKRNADLKRLVDGDRKLNIVDTSFGDYQVLSYNATGSGPDAWTITLNVCTQSKWDYRDDKGKVLLDQKDVQEGAEQVTAKYDGPNKVWKLTAFEPGDATKCGYGTPSDDSSTTTEEP